MLCYVLFHFGGVRFVCVCVCVLCCGCGGWLHTMVGTIGRDETPVHGSCTSGNEPLPACNVPVDERFINIHSFIHAHSCTSGH